MPFARIKETEVGRSLDSKVIGFGISHGLASVVWANSPNKEPEVLCSERMVVMLSNDSRSIFWSNCH